MRCLRWPDEGALQAVRYVKLGLQREIGAKGTGWGDVPMHVQRRERGRPKSWSDPGRR